MEDQEWSDEDIWDRKVDAQSKNIQRLLILQNQLDVLMTTSDIAFDSGSQLESKKIQAEIDDLMGKSTKGDNSNTNNDVDGQHSSTDTRYDMGMLMRRYDSIQFGTVPMVKGRTLILQQKLEPYCNNK